MFFARHFAFSVICALGRRVSVQKSKLTEISDAIWGVVWAQGAFCCGYGAGALPRPQVVDRGTTARYDGQLLYI